MRAGFYSSFFIRLAAVLLVGLGLPAFAEGDPPGRIARLNYSEGVVSYAPAGDDEFVDADLNRPLVVGDKLWTDKGVRAELQAGSAAVRMDGRTRLTVLAIDDQSTQLSVTQGTVFVRVRSLPEGENFEVDTPNLAWRASYPGDYRIDVDAQRGTTRVTIHSGTGAVYGENGQALPMGGGQQIVFKGRALAQVDAHEQPPQDNFDRWAAERNRREDQSVAARYVPREVVGYQLLDASGQWQQDAAHGVVWFPQGVNDKWAPYRNGRWEWMAPWGWTWIDDAPWAFVTSHYGRWALVNNKWGWVPGRMGLRPLYAPALVAFVGNPAAPLAVGGKQTVAWFPLAPGEPWQPAYKASPLYISSINANMPPVQQGGSYTYQRKPEALTAILADDFQRGKPSKGSWMRVAANALTNAQVVPPPGMPEHARTMMARAPARHPEIKAAINTGPTAAQQLEQRRHADAAKQADAKRQAAEARKLAEAQAQKERERLAREAQAERQQREQVAKAEQAQRAEQAKAAREQARTAKEETRVAQEQARAAKDQAKLAQAKAAQEQKQAAQEQKLVQARERERDRAEAQAKRAEQAKQREVVAKRAEQARREQVAAKREQAKREQVAALLRDREARREREQVAARRAQEAKRLAVAQRKEDEARRIAHAQQVEQARRAAERDAQVMQAQRSQREEAVRRVSEEKEKERLQREAWARQQQVLAEQWKRDQQAYEEQQRARAQRARPDLRRSQPAAEPEVWQRGVPILNPGRTS